MSQNYIDSYYTRSLKFDTAYPALEEIIETPICVIGGGMAGVGLIHSLTDRGVKPILLEAGRIGWAASGRNGGFVSPGYSLSPQKIADKLGIEDAKYLYHLTIDALALIKKRMEGQEDLICEGTGGILGASWYDDEKSVRAHVDFMNDHMDDPHQFIPRDQVRQACATNKYYDAYLKTNVMQAHSLNYTCHSATTAVAQGARIFENSPATHIQKSGHKWHITTPQGKIITDQLVMTCGVQQNNIQSKLARSVLSVATFVLLTEPIPELLEEILPNPYAVTDSRFSSNYYRKLPDGRLLWGGLVSMFYPSQEKLKKIMMKNLLYIYPQLKNVKAEVAWGGHMGYPTHKMPQVGQLPDGTWYGQGFGGHGMTSTIAVGEMLAKAIIEKDETYKLLNPFGLKYAGSPFGPVIAQSAYWAYQCRDWIEGLRKC